MILTFIKVLILSAPGDGIAEYVECTLYVQSVASIHILNIAITSIKTHLTYK